MSIDISPEPSTLNPKPQTLTNPHPPKQPCLSTCALLGGAYRGGEVGAGAGVGGSAGGVASGGAGRRLAGAAAGGALGANGLGDAGRAELPDSLHICDDYSVHKQDFYREGHARINSRLQFVKGGHSSQHNPGDCGFINKCIRCDCWSACWN